MFRIAALLVGVLLCSGCAASPQKAPASAPTSAATTTAAAPFTLVAHRGGALVYPESSAEAFEAVSKTAFPMETDLRQLQDGTLVPLHDETADRTMSGLTGAPAGITLDRWKAARIRHPLGGAEGTPTTWEAMLDSYGGKNILVPELKDPAIDVAAFAASILRRGVQEKVIVQTFSFSTAQALARAGLQVLYLLPAGDEPVPASITASGIGFVGPQKDISDGYLRKLKDSGLTVWPYTVNDSATAVRLRAAGADGVFTDTPWELAQQLAD
ncbi:MULTISPECIES: glycerophosphodiester phosphodiesterase [unclassified Arthrobacter]|uniref:glycerophosphodiester phosphodiesterase n=1 Tax=unclassified Arthrobacter TaxID=235627 RepID=UPI002E09CEAB|nr:MULTISPECIES: glycerophosphodiester phosphodiesterase [unclassified Arthrobacter]MEC5191071.1 glycerophosphoryl diester phosphodiesterase [Arthrobacter sp. MP_M4]MEC5202242.1 glycerophosphoryl diester phosphodiesterase [Arthrobacter sp. MP_M7]